MNDSSYINPNKQNLITYFYRVGQLQALVGNLFDFARNESKFSALSLGWEDYRNAYGNLDIWVSEIHIDDQQNLEAFTKRRIARDAGTDT
jgi:hypothetical protein